MLLQDVVHILQNKEVPTDEVISIIKTVYRLKDRQTTELWISNNYQLLRKLAYPHFAEYLDAQVKLLSGNSKLVAEGQVQLDEWVQDCLTVKARFPKPTDEVTKEDE